MLIDSKNKLPKISIITPSFNQGCFLEETITSVLEQGYSSLEYIIIDGGSRDNSVEVIKKYEKYLAYWISEKDRGQSDAINKGYRIATGDVINWLNSDDYYEPGALLKVGEAFRDDRVNVFCGVSRIFDGQKEYYSNGTDLYPGNLSKTIGWARIDQPETFFRKSVWDELGGIDQQFQYLMDRDFWIRYLLRYGLDQVYKSQELLAHFRLHPDSKTISQHQGFVREGLNYFYSLALLGGLNKEADVMAGYYDCMELTLKPVVIQTNLEAAIHNFFWYIVAESYAQNDWARFDYFSRHLNSRFLSGADNVAYRKLQVRRQVVPRSVKTWWNKKKQR